MTRTVLFVDEDQGLLDGLRRILRVRRDKWRALFAPSAEEALKILDREPVEALFTELVMPLMSGGDLLEEVARRHPKVFRYVLSGQINTDQALQVVGPAHQYLAKPCPPDRLLGVLDRAERLRDMLGQGRLAEIITGMRSIPAMPGILARIEAELAREEPSMSRLGATISHDPALSAGVLKLVNSSYFGLYTKVTDLAQAVALLGTDLMRGVVLGVHLFNALSPKGAGKYTARLRDHSYQTGCLAKVIAEKELPWDENFAGECFLGGLLHDVGQLLLLDRSPDYAKLVVKANKESLPLWVLEYEALGYAHGEVGGFLLGLWGVSDGVFEAVSHHEDPGRTGTTVFSPLAVVHVANVMEYNLFKHLGGARPLLDEAYLKAVGKLDRLPVWRETCEQWVAEHSRMGGDEKGDSVR